MLSISDVLIDKKKHFIIRDNHIMVYTPRDKTILYDCYGNLLKIIPSRQFDIHDGYYINGNYRIDVTNIKTLEEETSYLLKDVVIRIWHGRYLVSVNNGHIWTRSDNNYLTQFHALTGNVIRRIYFERSDSIYTIVNIDDVIFIVKKNHLTFDASFVQYGVSEEKINYGNIFLYNNKILIMWTTDYYMIVYGNKGKKKYSTKDATYIYLNHKYIIICEVDLMRIYNLQMQLLYITSLTEYMHTLYKFIIVVKKYKEYDKLTMYRLRPDCIIHLKTKIQNTSYWNILRLI